MLPPPVSDVIDVLAVGEPIELASLRTITDPAAIEEADMRGLITVEPVDGGMEVRVAHPLYGEVRRNRAPPLRLRRLRGLVAAELAVSGDREDVRVVMRRATLSLDSDLEPHPDLFIRAAQGAAWYSDMPLAERLADAAVRAGGGAEASFARAYALMVLNRGQQADVVLADLPAAALTDADRARLAFMRATNRLWALGDPDGAKRLIDEASQSIPAQAHGCIDVFHMMYWAAMGKPAVAMEFSKNHAPGELPQFVAATAARAITMAAGDAGNIAEAMAAADVGYALAARSFETAIMRFLIGESHVSALLQSGRIAEALSKADELRQQAADLPGDAALLSTAIRGLAALGAGRVASACALLDPLIELLSGSGESIGWEYRFQLPRTIALAMRGLADEAAASLAELENKRHPSWRWLDPEHKTARAWVTACQGAVSEAIKMVVSAAENARFNGQFAVEVMCLQTATQFGDRSCAPRLCELQTTVEGPRVGVAVRFAAALQAGDGVELACVSQEFESIGDLMGAIDAAAHAAVAYRGKDLRGSALGCSTRAQTLGRTVRCASTPALRQASEPLPLTGREREIVTLLGEGLTSPAIAQRLTLSVRTVEGHIYRAMAKTGAATREDLAALLPGHTRRFHG